jgi:hypothetical protein
MSTTAPDITTATGRTFITYKPCKRRFLNDWVRAPACSLASSSHSAGRAFTTTTACLRHFHPHSLMTASSPQPGIAPVPHDTQPLIAGHRRRTPNTYGIKHRSTARGTSSMRHCLNILRSACRTTSTVRFSFFTSPSVSSSSPSQSTRNTRSGHHVHFPVSVNIQAIISARGDVIKFRQN